ncbi:E3 ubiquitin-protein ligase XIAP-like [Pecten maximus]|uniref:E3 ubiquitin-protein ligase XIAP-like n=1 Tax=Pecten maximus TaxID=6579 RepID=UPI00145843B0|nr:E3 ubiquitin-protein ligase XIAP-like [Pecten maximus]
MCSSPPVEVDLLVTTCKNSFTCRSGDMSLDVDALANAGWCCIEDGRIETLCCQAVWDNTAIEDFWMQHVIGSPGCPFLRQQKGQAYIDSIQAVLTTTTDGEPVSEQPGSQRRPQDEPVLEQPDGQMKSKYEPGSEQPDFHMSSQGELEKLWEENDLMKKMNNCFVCEEEPRKITYLPCKHLACCGICDLAQLKCPICKESIKDRFTTFLS